jgi:hypothetical protein
MMEQTHCSETSVNFFQTTSHHILGVCTAQSPLWEGQILGISISPTWRSRNYKKEWICQCLILFLCFLATEVWYNTDNAKYNEWLSRKHSCFLFVSAWRPAVLTLVSCGVTQSKGRAIPQAVCRRLATAPALVRGHIRLCGICGGRSGTGAGFLRVLRFPLPILIPRLLHIHHLSPGLGTIGELVADVPIWPILIPTPKD